MSPLRMCSVIASTCALLAGILVFSLLAGCSDNTRPSPTVSASLRGLVLDTQGRPMAGAGVLVSLYPSVTFWPGEQTLVSFPPFGKSAADLLEMKMVDFCGEPVRHLDPGADHQPGDPVYLDGKNDEGKLLADGIYFVHATYSDTTLVEDLLLVWDLDHSISLDTHEVMTVTDEDGRFRIQQDCLPFDYVIDISGLDDVITVSRHVNILAVEAPDQVASSDSVYVDPQKGADIIVRFP